RFATVRNNVFDGTGSGDDYAAVEIWSQGDIPRPVGVEVYNNTIYRSDNASGWSRTGISVGASARKTIVKNNLVSFPNPGSTVQTSAVYNSSPDLVEAGNLLTGTPGFTSPDNVYADDPYVTDFSLLPGSAAIDAGVPVPVYEDMDGDARPAGDYDIGAYEN
ncbi:MAG TPA: choice-of-anchor Q domain-containing protein, partial [Spirochaetota bacterium]|nr:choice-of-anchor Q domain-containing protein [Spirochaetota bacterium]